MSFTYEQLLPFILALLLIWIIPMMLSRFGLTASDLMRMLFSSFRKQDYDESALRLRSRTLTQRTPHLKNSGTAELMELISQLVTFANRNHVMLVYPGTVRFGSKTANLVAFVVTRAEIIGLNCFGYSGKVGMEDKTWYQDMNGVRTKLNDPLALSRTQAEIVRPALKDAGLDKIPFRVVSVFTSRSVTLENAPIGYVFTAKGLITYLKERVAAEPERIDPQDTAKKLNTYVVRMKPEKKKNKSA